MRDRTYLAASRQLDALGVDSFEVGVRDRAGRMLTRSWSKAEVLKAIPWLKSQNAQGADVYVRPASPGGNANAGIVLVDDLSRETVARMKADGLTPALLVETSPGSYQVWVRVHENRIEQRTDELAAAPYDALGEERCERVRELARPLSRMIVDSGMIGFR